MITVSKASYDVKTADWSPVYSSRAIIVNNGDRMTGTAVRQILIEQGIEPVHRIKDLNTGMLSDWCDNINVYRLNRPLYEYENVYYLKRRHEITPMIIMYITYHENTDTYDTITKKSDGNTNMDRALNDFYEYVDSHKNDNEVDAIIEDIEGLDHTDRVAIATALMLLPEPHGIKARNDLIKASITHRDASVSIAFILGNNVSTWSLDNALLELMGNDDEPIQRTIIPEGSTERVEAVMHDTIENADRHAIFDDVLAPIYIANTKDDGTVHLTKMGREMHKTLAGAIERDEHDGRIADIIQRINVLKKNDVNIARIVNELQE